MLRMEDVRSGRVVDDDGFFEIAANLRQILVLLVVWTVTRFVITLIP